MDDSGTHRHYRKASTQQAGTREFIRRPPGRRRVERGRTGSSQHCAARGGLHARADWLSHRSPSLTCSRPSRRRPRRSCSAMSRRCRRAASSCGSIRSGAAAASSADCRCRPCRAGGSSWRCSGGSRTSRPGGPACSGSSSRTRSGGARRRRSISGRTCSARVSPRALSTGSAAIRPTSCYAAWTGAPATAAWLLWRLTGIPYGTGAHAYDLYEHGGDWWLMEKVALARFVHTSTEMGRRTLSSAAPTRPR